MSLSSTIAHDGAAPARGFSLRGIGLVVAGFALGVALGFVIGNDRIAAESTPIAAAPATGLPHDAFVRLNTTDLPNLAPATSAPAAAPAVTAPIGPQSGLNADFLYWNVGSFEYLVPAVRYFEPSSGPR